MARKKSAPTLTTRTVDAVDELVTELNTLSGIEWTRDAWVNKAPDNYGVVELSGEQKQLWADGHLIDSSWRVVLTAYVVGDSDEWPALVQAKLEALEASGTLELVHSATREFDFQINKVRWQWTVYMYSPLTWTVTEEVTA